jgi:SAM-dependent methyltransferase
MECLVCESAMAQKSDWYFSCSKCGFEKTTLESGAGRGVEGLEQLRRQNFQVMIDRLAKHKAIKGITCLEVGCAEGWFIDAMLERDVNMNAIEPSEMAVDLKAKGYNVIQGFFPDALNGSEQYDMIVFNDVFEHIPAPIGAIKKCEEHLKEGGLLVINLPDNKGVFYRISKLLNRFGYSGPFERMWQVGLPSPHVSYFSIDSLTRFSEKYTKLKSVDSFSLPSIAQSGLRERISASYSGIMGKILYWGIFCAMPLIKVLPQDISVVVFEKKKAL